MGCLTLSLMTSQRGDNALDYSREGPAGPPSLYLSKIGEKTRTLSEPGDILETVQYVLAITAEFH